MFKRCIFYKETLKQVPPLRCEYRWIPGDTPISEFEIIVGVTIQISTQTIRAFGVCCCGINIYVNVTSAAVWPAVDVQTHHSSTGKCYLKIRNLFYIESFMVLYLSILNPIYALQMQFSLWSTYIRYNLFNLKQFCTNIKWRQHFNIISIRMHKTLLINVMLDLICMYKRNIQMKIYVSSKN